jgi:hypothetical protein
MNFPATPIDLFQFPSRFKGDVQIFHANNLSTISFQQWIKPRGVNMSYIVCIGGGGGGGGAHSAASGTNGGGGGGGACSGISRLIVPTFLLPDSLYIQVGVGGIGGNATVAGGAGTNSYIMLAPIAFTATNALLASNTNAPGGGGAGTNGAVGTAGTVPTIATATMLSTIGQFSADVGLVGATGGAVAGGNGTDVTAWASIPLSRGAGGAGANNANFNGGRQTANAATNFTYINWPTTAGAVAAGGTGGTTSANIGGAGVSLLAPFIQSGGGGGGSNVSGIGGNGGKGGIGCGGGGGGKGTTGGRGGDGGNGLVAIFSW